MNKAITDGIVLMPMPFAAGLGLWSSGDGTPGCDTYATQGPNAVIVADPDFGDCLELQKTQASQKLRYVGETPVLPGCYLRITARVKAVSGPMPSVRMAGWAGGSRGTAVQVPTLQGPATAMTAYDQVITVETIVGTGDRTGVDMVWTDALYGHFGITLSGASGGVIRVDNIRIEDVTAAFQRKMMAMVDVRDYGAVGDGSTDDSAAFEAADKAAQGRDVLVPDGVFRLHRSVVIENRIRFEGTVSQPALKRFILRKGFDYLTYLDAFGDPELAFRKAYQALLAAPDHVTLDLCGRRIPLSAPLDMQGCDPDHVRTESRRVIRNGQFQPRPGPAWDTQIVVTQARRDPGSDNRLCGIANVAEIPVGALIEGAGVGREIYVTSRDIGAQSVQLSQPLREAQTQQSYRFRRFKYLLDFSGYDRASQIVFDDIAFQCDGAASGLMLAPAGHGIHLRDCYLNTPRDRGVTSPGRGCDGMTVDRCHLITDPQTGCDSGTIAINANGRDVVIRDNRVSNFKYVCVLGGAGALISGNHVEQDEQGARRGGIVIGAECCRPAIAGNRIDVKCIEWTDEYERAGDRPAAPKPA